MHTGLSAAQHRVFSLGDGAKLEAHSLWDIVSAAGHNVWVCGSMNVASRPARGCVLPDPWSIGAQPSPPGEFDAYLSFVRRYVQEHTRQRVAFGLGAKLSVMTCLVRRGLSATTVLDTASQPSNEIRGRGKWKRVAILDRLQWDLFRWYWKRLKPTYAAFFSNSTAHMQHMHWLNMAPEAFALRPTRAEQAGYGDAVLFGYQRMDRIVGECLDLAGPDTTVVLCSALSQQPCLTYEDAGGRKFYRMIEPDALFAYAGVLGSYTYATVMSEEFKLHFPDPAMALGARERPAAIRVGERSAFRVRMDGATLHAGCCIFDTVEEGAVLTSAGGSCTDFRAMFYLVAGMKSGMHHPDGIFRVRAPDWPHVV